MFRRFGNIILNPSEEWIQIKNENSSSRFVIENFLVPFCLFIAVATFFGNFIFSNLLSISYTLTISIFALVSPFITISLSTFILNALLPSFSANKNLSSTFKLITYSSSASLLASLITGLFPFLKIVSWFRLYSIVLIWKGMSEMLGIPVEKKVGFTLLSILIIFGIDIILFYILQLILAPLIQTAITTIS